jgi:hypothetical protein
MRGARFSLAPASMKRRVGSVRDYNIRASHTRRSTRSKRDTDSTSTSTSGGMALPNLPRKEASDMNKTQDARTPGPWHLKDTGEVCSTDPMFPVPVCDINAAFWRNLRASGAQGMPPGMIDSAENCCIANGTFIVLACNSHDTLTAQVAALAEALRRISDHETRSDRRKRGMVDISEVESLQRTARAALALVKAGA